MPVDIDGYAVLAAITREPNVFPAIRNDVSKIGRTLVVKQLKEKDLSLQSLRAIAGSIGQESFCLILDPMSDSELKSLVTKVDKFNIEAKVASPHAQRKLISDLADGNAEPFVKQVIAKTPKEKLPAKEKVERAINSRSMRATKR